MYGYSAYNNVGVVSISHRKKEWYRMESLQTELESLTWIVVHNLI